MCRVCRQQCRGIRFDFQCKKFYHDYCKGSSYVKPDIVCLFNPALHQPEWSKSIKSALNTSAPVLVTSGTAKESFADLEKVEKFASNDLEIVQTPQQNPFASTLLTRNFTVDMTEPIMFKNQFYFIVRRPKDLINL